MVSARPTGRDRVRPGGAGRAEVDGGPATGAQALAEETPPLVYTRDHFERKPEDVIAMLLTIERGLGYLPEHALLEVARLTKLPPATVYGVATFYEQFRLKPCAKHTIKLCTGTPCHLRGADRILDDLQATFDIKPGETTPDGSFTLETVGCFGPCALAPLVVVDDDVKGRMTPSKTRDVVAALLRNEVDPDADGRPA